MQCSAPQVHLVLLVCLSAQYLNTEFKFPVFTILE